MFKNHDKNLELVKKITKYLFIVADALLSLSLLIWGIMLCCQSWTIAIGILMIIIGIPVINAVYFYTWMLNNLMFDNMYDIKLIRNKLYGADNATLGLPIAAPSVKEQVAGVDTFAEIKKIKELLDAGIITEEEFAEMKKKFL